MSEVRDNVYDGQPYRVPSSVTWAEYQAATKPLVELLGLDVNEVFQNGITFRSATALDEEVAGYLSVTMSARAVGDEASRSAPVHRAPEGLMPPPGQVAELAWQLSVQVRH